MVRFIRIDMAKFIFQISEGVPEDIVRVVKYVFGSKLALGLKHNLVICIENTERLTNPSSGKKSLGIFGFRNNLNFHKKFFKKGESCKIKLAGRANVDLDKFIHICLHEFAHYEQYRDNKALQERGVNVRAKNLRKQLIG